MFWNNIRNKLFVLLLVATVVPTLSSIIITYLYTKESMKTEAIRENERLLYQISMNVTHYMDKLNDASLSVYIEPSKNSPGLYSITRYGGTDFSTVNEIYRSLQVLSRLDQDIYQVHLYAQNQNKSYLMVNDVLKTIGEAQNPFEAAAADSQRFESVFVEPMHMSHDYGKRGLPFVPEEQVISFHRKFYLQPNVIPLGVITFDVKLDFFSRLINNADEDGGGGIFIVDAKGGIVFDPSGEAAALQKGSSDWLLRMSQPQTRQGSFEYAGGDGILLYERIHTGYLDWYIVKRIPYVALYQNARTLAQINSFVLLLFLVIAVLSTFLISTRFTTPIKQLIRVINKVESGNLKVRMETDRTDEIGMLSKQFSKMIETIDRLIVMEYKWKLATKINQLKALQAQINPHFLNNALQSIATKALHSKQRDIYKLISNLGKMMDYHMDTGEETVPLEREIEHVNSYLDLQKQRFEEKLQVDIRCDADARDILVPKMILQPVVENYFKHGASTRAAGLVEIECSLLPGDMLRIRVRDNGTGMTGDAIAQLQSRLDMLQENNEALFLSDHIGLINVYSRLRLYFGPHAAMLLERPEPEGFQVTMLMPYRIRSGQTV